MRFPLVLFLALFAGFPAWTQSTFVVGGGAPSDAIRAQFVSAFFRNNFQSLVSLPPLGPVSAFGTPGLRQEFQDAAKTENVRLALVKPNRSEVSVEGVPDVFQVFAPVYAYLLTLGVGTVGYPTMDTRACPVLAANSCHFQLFDRNYALFSYDQSTVDGRNFFIRDPLYSRWATEGGINALGPPVIAEQTVTSSAGSNASYQAYAWGALFRITSGVLNGRTHAVKQPIYGLYVANGGPTAFLGFPSSEPLQLPSGNIRQTFEGGSIEYAPETAPFLRLPVAQVLTAPSASTLRLNVGDTVPMQAGAYAANGSLLEGRDIAWVSSNSRVVSIEGHGQSVVLRAVGGGTATITAISEGKSSQRLSVFVSAPCCFAGEGAPTAGIQQAFQDAITRNRIQVQLPTPHPVRRFGNGYVQEFQGVEPNAAARYLVAKPDRSPSAYVLAGQIFAQHTALGGVTGPLGYPTGDATPGGRQLFEEGALGGSPPVLVAGAILSRWASLLYETGAAGNPTAAATPLMSFLATDALAQRFTQGGIYGHLSGPHTGRAFFVSGLIFAKYVSLGGASGTLGLPIAEEVTVENRRRQLFEGGYAEFSPGDTEARVFEQARRPQVSVAPGTVVAGGRVRIAISGFATGAALRVSLSGVPDFTVQTTTGAYAWEIFVPVNALSATVTVRATDVASGSSAQGSYRVEAVAEARMALAKVQGDGQNGFPSAVLPLPLRVVLTDAAGNPVPGQSVRFAASPGGRIENASTVTDARGVAQAWFRLPPAAGVALATVEAGRQVVTFSANAATGTLTNFPRQTATGDALLGPGPGTLRRNGALLAAASSVIRFYQDRGELVSSQGLAEPSLLNDFLHSYCIFDALGNQLCDGFLLAPRSLEPIPNLWRMSAFVGGNLDVAVDEPALDTIRDQLAQGTPVLVGLSLTAANKPAGSHFLVAIGVAGDGGILVHDPIAAFARNTLGEYLAGFSLGSETWRGTLAGAIRLIPRSPSPTGFLAVAGSARFQVSSPVGACGRTLSWQDAAAAPGQMPEALPGQVQLRYCEGRQLVHQLDVDGPNEQRLTLTDLGNPGSRIQVTAALPASFRVARPAARWEVEPMQTQLAANAVLNAASFTADVAPGSLAAIFGSGLWSPAGTTSVEVGGMQAAVVAATPFQVNAQLPLELTAGSHTLRVNSAFGSAEQSIRVAPAAPAIFTMAAQQGVVVNQDGSLNSPQAPARRGQVIVAYSTGFGAVVAQGALRVAQLPVTASLEGQSVPVNFAGLVPGFFGLYQANVAIPAATAPGIGLRLELTQAGVRSNSVSVAVQ